MPPLSQQIREARHKALLSQKELATILGCSTRSLQGWEAGRVPQYRYMRALRRFIDGDALDGEQAA